MNCLLVVVLRLILLLVLLEVTLLSVLLKATLLPVLPASLFLHLLELCHRVTHPFLILTLIPAARTRNPIPTSLGAA